MVKSRDRSCSNLYALLVHDIKLPYLPPPSCFSSTPAPFVSLQPFSPKCKFPSVRGKILYPALRSWMADGVVKYVTPAVVMSCFAGVWTSFARIL